MGEFEIAQDREQERARGGASGGAATRRRLLDVAAGLFAEHGYAGTSFRELITASGLSKGAFYFHFDSKRDLALAVFRDRTERLGQAVMRRVDPHAPALEQFRQLWLTRAQLLAEDPSLRCVRKLAATVEDDPALAGDIAALHRGPVEMMGGLLAAAQAQGDVRPDVDPMEASAVAFAAAIGIDEVSEREAAGADVVSRAEAFLKVFLHGVAER